MTSIEQIIKRIDAMIEGHVIDDLALGEDAMRCSPGPVAEQESPFGPLIDAYTRSDAIADGALVQVPEAVSREAGLTVPVALTRAAWEDCVAWGDADNRRKGICNDEDGRLWDVVWMTRAAINRSRLCDRDRVRVVLHRVPRPGRGQAPRLAHLVAVMGSGDSGEPVLTVMQPDED